MKIDLQPIYYKAINHIATGKQFKETRKKLNISIESLAAELQYTVDLVDSFEKGIFKWDEGKVKKWSDAMQKCWDNNLLIETEIAK